MSQPDQGSTSPDARREAEEYWATVGPVKYRLERLWMVLKLAITLLVIDLTLATVGSFYPGAVMSHMGPKEVPAVAEVGRCERVGPVSGYGFGYWWKCWVTVRVENGRTVETVVGRSIVTPDDAGRKVEFREACKGKDHTDCAYGRPVHRGLQMAMSFLRLITGFFWVALLGMIAIFLVYGILGVPGYYALRDRLRGRRSGR